VLKDAVHRYREAFAKADAESRRPHPGAMAYPKRPEGMHRDTFGELLADVEEARDEWYESHMAQVSEHIERKPSKRADVTDLAPVE
jgi:hypothetical protein